MVVAVIIFLKVNHIDCSAFFDLIRHDTFNIYVGSTVLILVRIISQICSEISGFKFFGSKYLTAYYEGVHTLTVRPYTRWGFAGEDFQVVLDIRAGSSSKQQAQELTPAEAEAAADKAAAAAAATARELQETEAPTGGVKPLEGTGAPSAAGTYTRSSI